MKKETWKILLACALGAGIGSFISLEITSIYFIWVGLIFGGLIGYLSYNFRKVLAAIPRAYRAARGWQPYRSFWRSFFSAGLAFACLTSWFLIIMCPLTAYHLGYVFTAILFPCTWVVASLLSALLVTQDSHSKYVLVGEEREWLPYQKIAFWTAPPIVLFYHLPRGIWWLMKRMPLALWWVAKRIPSAIVVLACFIGRAIKETTLFLGRFGWQVFIRIHSQKRLICGTDAMIGAGIGYLAGSAIIGALAGALIGLVNYELVTRRWLIPRGYVEAPARAKT